MVKFPIVYVSSSYNVIFGRPILNSFQAIISTFHMKLKLLVEGRVGEMKWDQYQSRKCYVESARAAIKASLKRLERIEGGNLELKKCKFRREDDESPIKVQVEEELMVMELYPGK